MPATYDLTTDCGKVRLLIQDTNVAAGKFCFSDEELTFFLAETGEYHRAAAMALRSWAALLGRQEEMVKLGAWQGDKRDVCGKMLALADQLEKQAAGAVPYFGHARMDWTVPGQIRREIAEAERLEE